MEMRNQESIIPLSLAARAVWAKTGGGEMSHLWSPLYVHMGDSAQIARLLWREWLPESEKRFVVNALLQKRWSSGWPPCMTSARRRRRFSARFRLGRKSFPKPDSCFQTLVWSTTHRMPSWDR